MGWRIALLRRGRDTTAPAGTYVEFQGCACDREDAMDVCGFSVASWIIWQIIRVHDFEVEESSRRLSLFVRIVRHEVLKMVASKNVSNPRSPIMTIHGQW